MGKVVGHSLKSCADLRPCPIQCPSTRSPPCTRARAPCPNIGTGTYKTLCSHWCPSGTVPGYSARAPSVNDALEIAHCSIGSHRRSIAMHGSEILTHSFRKYSCSTLHSTIQSSVQTTPFHTRCLHGYYMLHAFPM